MTESKMSRFARVVGYITIVVVGFLLAAFLMYALTETISGETHDYKCQEFAEVSGGKAHEVGTFGECYVEMSNGMRVTGRSIQR